MIRKKDTKILVENWRNFLKESVATEETLYQTKPPTFSVEKITSDEGESRRIQYYDNLYRSVIETCTDLDGNIDIEKLSDSIASLQKEISGEKVNIPDYGPYRGKIKDFERDIDSMEDKASSSSIGTLSKKTGFTTLGALSDKDPKHAFSIDSAKDDQMRINQRELELMQDLLDKLEAVKSSL